MFLTIDSLVPLHGVHLEAMEDVVDFYEQIGFEDLGYFYPGRQSTQMFYPIEVLKQTAVTPYLDPYNLEY